MMGGSPEQTPGRPGSGCVSHRADHPPEWFQGPRSALHISNTYSIQTWIVQRPQEVIQTCGPNQYGETFRSPSAASVLPWLWNHDTVTVSLAPSNPQTVLERIYIGEVSYF